MEQKTIYTVILFLPAMACLIELFHSIKFKKELYYEIMKGSRRKKMMWTEDPVELYALYSKRSKEIGFFDDTLKLRTINLSTTTRMVMKILFNLLPILIAILSVIALFTTTINENLEIDFSIYLEDIELMAFFLQFTVIFAFSYICISVLDKKKSDLLKKHLAIIDEIEKKQPIKVRLSEDQYRALSASSGLQRTVYRFGRSEDHGPPNT